MVDSSTERLLSAVWGNRKGFVFVPHKDLSEERRWHETPGIPINGSLPPLDIPDRGDVYFCPVVFSKPQRRKEYALPTNLLWADLDPVNPNDCRIRPSIAWESSPGRFQALWFLNREIEPNEAAALSKRIAYADGADTGGWDLTQVLRLPGTKNFKYDAAPTVKLLWAKRFSYSPNEIKQAYPPVNGEAKVELDWPDVKEIQVQSAIKALPAGLQLRIQRKSVIDRSQEMQKLARDLIKAKVSPEITLHILQRLPYNKFAGRGDERKQLLKQVTSALAAVDQQQKQKKKSKEQKVEKARDTGDIEQMIVRKWNDFLAVPTKLQWLVEDSWVDQSVGFISGRSKSYKTWLALDLGLSVVSGKPFLGTFPVARTGPVILVQEEDPMPVLQERLRLIGDAKDMLPSVDWLPGDRSLRINFPDWPIYIINLQGFNLQHDERVDQVRKLIAQVNPVMVILDPLVVMLGGVDEYRASEVSGLLQTIKFWREEFGCSVVVVHHWNKGKGDDGERGGQHMYGSFAFHAWLESALHVAPIIEESESQIDTVIIEREFKAAPSGRALKVKFNIDSVDKYQYLPEILEGTTAIAGHAGALLDIMMNHPEGMSSKDLIEETGFSRSNVIENMGKLVKQKKIRRVKGGGRGVPTVYYPIQEE